MAKGKSKETAQGPTGPESATGPSGVQIPEGDNVFHHLKADEKDGNWWGLHVQRDDHERFFVEIDNQRYYDGDVVPLEALQINIPDETSRD